MTFQSRGKGFGVSPGSEQQEGSVSINTTFGQGKKKKGKKKWSLGRFLAVLAKGELSKAQAQAAFQELSLELLVSKQDRFHFKA